MNPSPYTTVLLEEWASVWRRPRDRIDHQNVDRSARDREPEAKRILQRGEKARDGLDRRRAQLGPRIVRCGHAPLHVEIPVSSQPGSVHDRSADNVVEISRELRHCPTEAAHCTVVDPRSAAWLRASAGREGHGWLTPELFAVDTRRPQLGTKATIVVSLDEMIHTHLALLAARTQREPVDEQTLGHRSDGVHAGRRRRIRRLDLVAGLRPVR